MGDQPDLATGQQVGFVDAPPVERVEHALQHWVTLFAEGLNLFNEKTFLHSAYKERVISFETYGPRYAFGMRLNF